jgi:AraC family ethanolamine operon transcriptional activator
VEAITGGGFKVITFSVREEALVAHAEATGRRDPLPLLARRELFRCPKPLLDEARRWLRKVAIGPELLGAPVLEGGLVGLVFRVLHAAVPDRNPAVPYTRRRAVARAEEYLRDQSHHAPSIAELCRAAGCSERTLQYAFREYLGVTPKAYLQAERLKRVRRGLREADARTAQVTDVANAWGFWHMGQFAADYRKLFGELPSQTLNWQARGSNVR